MSPRTLATDQDRKFLHDLATPITVARTLVKKVLEEGQNRETLSPTQLIRLEKILVALTRMEVMRADQKGYHLPKEMGE